MKKLQLNLICLLMFLCFNMKTFGIPVMNFEDSGTVTKYEAEDAQLTGVSIAKFLAGYSGTGYMDGGTFDADGDKITFTVNVATTAKYPVIVRFQNTCGKCDKTQNISINGGPQMAVVFSGTGGWQDLNLGNIQLNAGNNTIAISKSWGWMHIDYLAVGENDVTPPSVPLNLKITNTTQTSFSLSWDPSTDNMKVSGYEVYFGNTLKTTTNLTSASFSGLTCNTSYTDIKVKAVDDSGNKSDASSAIQQTTSSCVLYHLNVTNGKGSGTYNSGVKVTITANEPPSGQTFDQWTGSSAIEHSNLSATTIIIPEGNADITANYKNMDASTLLDPNATAETVNLWNFMKSIYGQKMLTGCWTETQFGGHANVVKCTGEMPAIWGQDMNSWYKNRTDPNWITTWKTNIQGFQTAHKRGQILQLNWHWQMPSSKVNGIYTRDAWGKDASGTVQMMTNQQWSDIVTPGTALYDAMIEDVDYHVVNYLKKIVDEKGVPIPIIFRPMHEIDGGWFWWTCTSDPTKTAKLYKIIQDRIINFHGCHNLIWVFNPGGTCNGGSSPPFQTSEVNRRKSFYPGDAFCDITGIDLYDYDPVVRGTFINGDKTYRDAWNLMKAISSNKMIALCESEGFPDADRTMTDPTYAPWLYCLPWYSINYTDSKSGSLRDLCAWNQIQLKSAHALSAGDFTITSIRNSLVQEQSGISIYPNPTNDKINVVMKEMATKLELFDLSGRLVLSKKVNSTHEIIDMAAFDPGVYLMTLRLKNGENFSSKIMKQ